MATITQPVMDRNQLKSTVADIFNDLKASDNNEIGYCPYPLTLYVPCIRLLPKIEVAFEAIEGKS